MSKLDDAYEAALAATKPKRTSRKRPTYKTAATELYVKLGEEGWKLSSPTLKVRHATDPYGRVRYWFKPQAVWMSVTYTGGSHSLNAARSTWFDIREPDTLQKMLDTAEKEGW